MTGLLLAKFAGVLIEIAISNSLVLYFREEPYTEIMHLCGQLRSVQENARNLRSFLRVVRQVQKSSYRKRFVLYQNQLALHNHYKIWDNTYIGD